MDEEELQLAKTTLLVLRKGALWPQKGQFSNKRAFYIRFVINVLIMIPLFLGILGHIYKASSVEGLDYSEDVALVISFVGNIGLFTVFSLKQDNIFELYQILSDFKRFPKPTTFDSTNRRLNLGSRGFEIYCVVGIAIDSAWVLTVDAAKCRETNKKFDLDDTCALIAKTYYTFFDLDQRPHKQLWNCYTYYVALQIFRGGALVMYSYYEIATHIALKIKNLNENLTQCFDTHDENEQRRRLTYCIKYHLHVIDCVKKIENCYKYVLGIHYLLTSTVFACILNQIATNFSLGAIMHLCGWVVGLFMACNGGQLILTASDGIPKAVYDAKWYNASVSLQRTILIMLQRSQRLLKVNAVPLGTMDMELFQKIVQTSYSYFNLLNQTSK